MWQWTAHTSSTPTGPQDHYSVAGREGNVNVSLLQPLLGGAVLEDTPTVDRAASVIITADSGGPTPTADIHEVDFSMYV